MAKKKTNNDLQNITQETKIPGIPTPLKTRGELRYSRMVSSFWSTCGTSRVTFRSHYFNTSNGNAYSSKKNTETGWLNLF